ncbi:NEAT domain-containing protein [Paenibacillus contaminans]|uniref:NEAT domain-containing protein n=1 Tax=Paenibacillus contaminans TaxID=450362 RepID=A0A329M605_9BACL|nr:NEAT domain-containing protein [Paenibacillus contaminans]RAV15280.1 hypothetical protein DQG23_30210 [Paenibacillus contaminans]
MPKDTITAWGLSAVMVIALFFLAGNNEAAAAKLADGTYEVEYTVKKPDDESVSISNDYFEKPARVEVRNGEAVVYFQTNHNKWITSLKYPAGPDGVQLQAVDANEAEDTKVFRLPHKDLLVPAALAVHVKIDELDYDHAYTVRLVFKTDQLLDESAPVAEGKSLPDEPVAGAGGEAKASDSVKEDTRNEPGKAEPKQQELPAVEPKRQESPAVEPKQQELSASEPKQQEQESSGPEKGAEPERSAENAAPAASGGGAVATGVSDSAESGSVRQEADQEPSDNSEDVASGSSTWLVIMPVVLAGCALGIVFAYRHKRRKRQAHS